ncbi:unnamed protein product [Eruca vesicaria subsp. sativa]|uniref:Uncharacterized protein n=1 Tax=Eruca vesicaria subsp. sativa TaxID=29727 RepID=A0ABC8JR06_ERUVS|nr:unnamed protein product [Eruca vesicaria subsp. sativa]
MERREDESEETEEEQKNSEILHCVFRFPTALQVLCDGTFVHHLVSREITPADTVISELLEGPVKLFTTKCVVAELQKLGKDFMESLEAAQMLSTATPCCCITCKRLIMTDAEKWMLEKQSARILASRRGEGTAEDEQWETPRVVSTRNGLGVKDRPQFKRNRAKVMYIHARSNPLSCMKKKKVTDTKKPQSKPKAESKPGGQEGKKGGKSGTEKRTRKRSRKGKAAPERT